jgi:PAS domain S-box-containing protein
VTGAGLAVAAGLAQAALAAACVVVALAVLTVMHRRRDVRGSARAAGWLFVIFLLATAALHLAALLLPRVEARAFLGVLEIAAAFAGLAAAIMIWPLVPRLLKLPSPRDLARANHALSEMNASLETTIAWRTHELEQIRHRFEQALSRSNTSVFTQDRDLRYTWVYNPGLGLSEEALLGRTTEEVLPPGAEDESLPLKLHALETGQVATGIVAVPRGGEGRAFLDMTVSPTLDAEGRIDGVLCTAIDVTENRLFEVRLAAMATQLGTAYQRFELALENSPITVFEQGPDLSYTYMYNPPPGTTVEDFIGKRDADLFPESQRSKVVPPKERILAGGGREALEVEIEVGGELRFYDLRLEPKTDA